MKVTVLRVQELSADLRTLWSSIRASRPDLASPFFEPEFFEAADSCRPGVRIGVIEDGGRPIGFLPFERGRLGIGDAVGGRLSDFQAPIVPAGVQLDPAQLIERCGLRLWRFHHLLGDAGTLERCAATTAGSPVLDLHGGFEKYYSARSSTVSIDRIVEKSRQMHRVHHDVQFDLDCREDAVLEHVILRKREQCLRTRVSDFLGCPENAGLLRAVHRRRTPEFAGVLSVLRADGRIVAAHFGMRSRDTLHYWFPCYEHEFREHSPGLVLLLELVRAAASTGLTRLDLGKGPERYKRSFSTREIALGEGVVAARPLYAWLCHFRARAIGFLRETPVTAPLRVPFRVSRAFLRRQRLKGLVENGGNAS